ncbi:MULTISPECIES: hypothetical protein [Streptacidiphilus]|uniref:ATP-binding protein n=1 Tax=Streptacidiphilus cavernicola TaxID=3342716 RepID=A0ABV6V1I4_9ACTN|nr:hypothetical protein [Streptacidiphilus jeojiense]
MQRPIPHRATVATTLGVTAATAAADTVAGPTWYFALLPLVSAAVALGLEVYRHRRVAVQEAFDRTQQALRARTDVELTAEAAGLIRQLPDPHDRARAALTLLLIHKWSPP